jgi:nucleotide-binding universal stress UspA family protein
MGYQKILVALDRSSQTDAIFENALLIAKHNNAALMLFYCLPVIDPGITPYSNLYGEDLINFSQSLHEKLKQDTNEARQWLGEYCQKATEQGISAEFDYKVGEAGPLICELARTWEADLIIIGRRGLRGFAEMFLGSVSNYVIHHSRCSVLVVQGTDNSVTSDQ